MAEDGRKKKKERKGKERKGKEKNRIGGGGRRS